MGVTIATTRAACSTSTGTQDFTTTDCGGLTPVAALFIITQALTDGTPQDHAVFGIGAATGSSERWAYCTYSSSGIADSSCGRRGVTDACVLKLYNGGGTIEGEADFDSFITNGVRIDWSDAPDSAFLMTVVLFCGTDVSAYAGTFNPNGTQDNSVSITDPDFEPDMLLVFSPSVDFDDSSYTELYNSLGVAVNDGSETQRSAMFHSEHGTAKQEVHSNLSNARCAGSIASGGGAWEYTIELTAFTSTGFTAYTRDGSGDSNDHIAYLALNFNSAADVWADDITHPTGTGSDSVTGLGFEPQFVIQGLTGMHATNSFYEDGQAGTYGLSVLTANAQYCNTVQEQDASASMDTQCLTDDKAIALPEDDGTAGNDATFTSFDSGGWTRNFTSIGLSSVIIWAAAVQEYSGAPPEDAMPMAMDHYHRRRT